MGQKMGAKGGVRHLLIGILFGCFWFGCESHNEDHVASQEDARANAVTKAKRFPKLRFGMPWDGWAHVDSGIVEPGQSLSHLLANHSISQGLIFQIARKAQPTYDVRKIRSGRPYWFVYANDTLAEAFIYERNPREYVVFKLIDDLEVRLGSHPTRTETKRVAGVIDDNLYVDLEEAGSLALAMANVYAWTVDFSRLQPGDAFDVLYEREYVENQPVGMPRVIGCHFSHRGRDLPAYRYDQGAGPDYFDADGGSLRKAFLKAPVEFSRISSPYNLRRYHPVLGRVKAHLGTDYAAPHGTPIVAVGDGIVTKSGYTSGNGNYVKIRHNSTYETQYLHMSRRAAQVGESVHQGQVIGYVGATGLATGPHVCFRFWKNGQQVNHLNEDFPPSEPIAEDHLTKFQRQMRSLQAQLAK
jgi:murein DD-endopeptidase MepM/ murein hydrolase activator NlpD